MASSLPNILSRLNALTQSHRQTSSLIQRLQQLSGPSDEPYDPEARLELSSDLQQALKDQDEELEILRLDVEDLLPPAATEELGVGSRLAGHTGNATTTQKRDGERDVERERVASQVHRLGEDLKSSRQSFRQAQLSAKRFADAEKARERAALFAPAPPSPGPDDGAQPKSADEPSGATEPPNRNPRIHHRPQRSQTQKHLTQDDLTLAASSDVTSALHRTHALLQSSVSQSQFAAETLATSTAALSDLSESYGTLDTMLASSRSLVGTLLRSQKSDTWYLETAFYLCCATLGWLIFRRWIYGPAWWLVWLPAKWLWWFVATAASSPFSSSSAIARNSNNVNMPGSVAPSMTTPQAVMASKGKHGIPTNQPVAQGGGWRHVPVGGKGGGWGGPARPPGEGQTQPEAHAQAQQKRDTDDKQDGQERLIDKIGEMAERVREQMENPEHVVEDEDETEAEAEVEADNAGKAHDTEAELGAGDGRPWNPKKRMWEEPPPGVRDEL